jgi:integrase/recombinase XerD
LNADAAAIIEERLAARESDRWTFLNEFGCQLDDDNCYRNLKRTLKKAGQKDGSPHTFRHTFASHLVIGGESLYKVKQLLRHKSIVETEIYTQLSKESVRETVRRLTLPNDKRTGFCESRLPLRYVQDYFTISW